MPIYMDRHDVSANVTAAIVAQLHQQDLAIQHEFKCRGLTYWFDSKRKTAFCLIDAPNKEAIQKMHDQAHGEVPHEIIEVNPEIVESFLGRIEDPKKQVDANSKIIEDSAFRVIMVVGFDNQPFLFGDNESESAQLRLCMRQIEGIIRRFEGAVADQKSWQMLGVFRKVSQAVFCAIELYASYRFWSESPNFTQGNLKMGISAGVPVDGNKTFFEDALKIGKRLFYLSGTQVYVSSEISELYQQESRNLYLDHDLFKILKPADEQFMNELLDFLAESWQIPELKVDDLSKHMGYSKSQFYRKIVSLVGMSPNSFIKDYRLNKSLKLIHKRKGSIAEIAYDSGFNSPSYFTKCFHQKYGMLPSEYHQHSA
ncbi:nickel-binding protein [Mangrovibacterium sp.]|uniref:nickel-binding protein n=1 Tax=Mangrovibacterium sp. TaxID=1961364 RepID=UPI0035634464